MVQEKLRHTALRSGAFSRMKDKDKDRQKEKAKHKNKVAGTEETSKLRNPFRKLMKTKQSVPQYTASAGSSLYPTVSAVSTCSSSSSTTQTSKPSHSKRKDNRRRLFRLQESEISVYKSIKETSSTSLATIDSDLHHIIKNSKSSLIAQGKFEIYQMNSTLNYLSCGPLTHPILPSCTMIKINTNTYIIPIKNPTRYWRLTLNTEDEEVIKKFESTIRPISKFRTDLLMDFTLSSPFCTIIDSSNVNTTLSSSVTLKSFLHVDSDEEPTNQVADPKIDNAPESLTLHHPIPIRPNSASTTSLKSSILHKYNSINSISSMETSQVYCGDEVASTRKGSEIHAISEPTEIQQQHKNDTSNELIGSLSPHQLADVNTFSDSEFELDLDLDLERDLEADLILDGDLNLEDFVKTSDGKCLIGKRSISVSDLDELDDVDFESDDLLCMWNDTGDGITKRYSLSFKAYDVKKPLSIDVFDKYKSDIKSVLKLDSTGLLDTFLE